MSITTASICLSKYLGLPTDVTNCIALYAGTEKWIPQFDTNNKLTGKINPASAQFDELSDLCYNKPHMITGQTVVLNDAVYTGNTFVQARRFSDDGDIHIMLYTEIEVAEGVFHYLSIVQSASPYSVPVIQFEKGTLHRPMETLSWNQQRRITSFHMVNDAMLVSYADFQVQYVWNEQLNIGEYIVDLPDDNETDDYALVI